MPITSSVAVIGGGPGGLMVAERLALAGTAVTVFEQMPSVGRKFLLAGRGGLNLTHSEPTDRMLERYGTAAATIGPAIKVFDADALRAWAAGLGEPTIVGSSGRVFPESFRATPLLRAWLARLDELGVDIRTRHRWTGWRPAGNGVEVSLVDASGEAVDLRFDALVMATGGASWPKVGSDGGWSAPLAAAGIGLSPFRAANSGFVAAWTDVFRERFAGEPIKNISLSCGGRSARGEGVVTETGVEGGVFYAIGATIRDAIEEHGQAVVDMDLHPDLDLEHLAGRLERRRPKDSTSTALRRAGLSPVAIGLVREASANALPSGGVDLAILVKGAPLKLIGVEDVARAISTAGGVRLEEVDGCFMLRRSPGTFVVGEMLDWEAPTGGYLLQATFSIAVAAASGVVDYLSRPHEEGT